MGRTNGRPIFTAIMGAEASDKAYYGGRQLAPTTERVLR